MCDMTNLDKTAMVKILNENFGFKLIDDDDFGTAIEMSARDAFRYSLIQGSPYLFDEYGFTCKEQLNVFYHRSSLNLGYYMYCPGLFGVSRKDNELILDKGNSPYYLNKEFPSLFSSSKIILFHDYDESQSPSRAELERDIHKKIKERGDNPENYILTLVSNTSSLKESFLEFITCEYFNRDNYLTESQVPFENNAGIPDFAAYKFPHMKFLAENNFIDGGCCIPEIAAACVFTNSNTSLSNPSKYDVIIGEAKMNGNAKKQLDKHYKLKLASKLFVIKPFNSRIPKDYGLMHIQKDFKINYNSGRNQPQKTSLLKSDEEFLTNYIKFYVIANLPIEKIKDNFIDVKSPIPESEQLIENTINYDFFDLIKLVKKEMP